MTLLGDMSPGKRRSILAVCMLAVLLVMTAAAWLITRTRGGPRPGELWYEVLDANGQPVGWRALGRTTGAEGARGYDVFGHPAAGGGSTRMQWSRWALNAPATQGSYFSFVPAGLRPDGQIVYQMTRIKFNAGRVIIAQEAIMLTPTPTPAPSATATPTIRMPP